jgi:hypothetical protein
LSFLFAKEKPSFLSKLVYGKWCERQERKMNDKIIQTKSSKQKKWQNHPRGKWLNELLSSSSSKKMKERLDGSFFHFFGRQLIPVGKIGGGGGIGFPCFFQPFVFCLHRKRQKEISKRIRCHNRRKKAKTFTFQPLTIMNKLWTNF